MYISILYIHLAENANAFNMLQKFISFYGLFNKLYNLTTEISNFDKEHARHSAQLFQRK